MRVHDSLGGAAHTPYDRLHMTDHGYVPSWLSPDMAVALAATAPPLTPADVTSAAETLTQPNMPIRAMDLLLRRGGNLIQAQQLVEALRALRDCPPIGNL